MSKPTYEELASGLRRAVEMAEDSPFADHHPQCRCVEIEGSDMSHPLCSCVDELASLRELVATLPDTCPVCDGGHGNHCACSCPVKL